MSEKEKALVAMSGGVDSSFAAACLQKQGFEVTGVHFLLWQPEPVADMPSPAQSAKKSAEQMGIEFRVIDLREQFRARVVDYFMDEYLRGRTPNPCSACNPAIKFTALLELADEMGATHVASGHYARVMFDACKSEHRLLEANDKSKDQSYFLAMLDQKMLSRLVFPLGEIKKSEVKKEAAALGLESANRKESQDVCFALSKNYADLIEARRPGAAKSGDAVDVSGTKIGVHRGIYRYTVGQHRGLAMNRPDLFVVAIDAGNNRIVVGPEKHLFHRKMKVSGMNWMTPLEFPFDCQAKIRYRFEKAPCRVEPVEDGVFVATFAEPQRAITPGQSAVFYLEDRVIGGGWIDGAFD
jgi:tRNA-uridine 2-sulfurtransferase